MNAKHEQFNLTPPESKEKSMKLKTINGLDAFECLSAMQKCIRRGMEREAMEFAVELIHTSKNFASMVLNRLEVISHEDIDTISQPWIVPFVHTVKMQAREWYHVPDNPFSHTRGWEDHFKLGKIRMAIGNAIRMMARAKKSREGDHFHAAIGLKSLIDGYVPEIPDFALDKHTQRGKAMGRDLEFFREESTKLSPDPGDDPYKEEAYEMWEKRNAILKSRKKRGR